MWPSLSFYCFLTVDQCHPFWKCPHPGVLQFSWQTTFPGSSTQEVLHPKISPRDPTVSFLPLLPSQAQVNPADLIHQPWSCFLFSDMSVLLSARATAHGALRAQPNMATLLLLLFSLLSFLLCHPMPLNHATSWIRNLESPLESSSPSLSCPLPFPTPIWFP